MKLKTQSFISQRDLSNGTNISPIHVWDQKLSKNYRNILFFTLIFAYLSLPFSYLGYIVEEGRILCIAQGNCVLKLVLFPCLGGFPPWGA